MKYFKDYRRRQWDSLEKNLELQSENLYLLLKYAVEKIPYYQKLAFEQNITLSRKNILKDLKKFPVITKPIIKREFSHLHNLSENNKWFYNYSGGSTGEPAKFIQDKKYNEHSRAVNYLHYEWAGYYYGDTMIELWGSQKDILKSKEKIHHRFAEWIRSTYLLNSFEMDKGTMDNYIGFINRKKPKIILAYAQSANEISKYIIENKIKVHSPHSVITSAGILYPEFRKNIETAFKSQVFNRYGSREIGSAACECEKHKGLHLSTFTHFFEILDDNLNPCKENEMGHLYITSLVNYSMPLIRFKIGDLAIVTNEKCSCGRGLPIIKSVIGRDSDAFKTADGKIIDGIFFLHFISVVHNNGAIGKFQLVQKDYNLIHIKVVINNLELFNMIKEDIEGSFKKVMGEDCKIVWDEVEDIKPLSSGKYRFTIREFN